jgi:hypothetical protein
MYQSVQRGELSSCISSEANRPSGQMALNLHFLANLGVKSIVPFYGVRPRYGLCYGRGGARRRKNVTPVPSLGGFVA